MFKFSLAETERAVDPGWWLGDVCITQTMLGAGCCRSSAGPAWRVLLVQGWSLGDQRACISWDISRQELATLFF